MSGEVYDDLYCSILVQGASLKLTRSDVGETSLDAFRELGRSYWATF